MYQALYRKWRPNVFDDVAGQPHVTTTLKRQVAAGRLSHAYLFTGTRGTGKTSCAKILARAANCLAPVDGNPCNTCAPCRAILDGSALDVVEMDAASHSSVDEVRLLREELVFAPVTVRRRVYIIDEVHMLSVSAFNALLIIMEEPPPHVLFILATTETAKIPATILSRCQRFAFRRLDTRQITEHLLLIAKKESIDLEQDAALWLAELADGAMRDALSLLDQCAAVCVGKLDRDAVAEALGLAGHRQIAELAALIAERDAENTLLRFEELYASGREAGALLDALSLYFRDALVAQVLKQPTPVDMPVAWLVDTVSRLQETVGRMARGSRPKIEAQICLLALCAGKDIPQSELPTAPPAPTPATAPPPTPKPAAQPAPLNPSKKPAPWDDILSKARPLDDTPLSSNLRDVMQRVGDLGNIKE